MPERQRGRIVKEVPLPDYRRATKFYDEPTSNTAYEEARQVIYETPCELSAYRTLLLPDETWHLLILGQTPTDPTVVARIDQAMGRGEAVELPEEVWRAFNQRRLEQTSKGPWTERRRSGQRLR